MLVNEEQDLMDMNYSIITDLMMDMNLIQNSEVDILLPQIHQSVHNPNFVFILQKNMIQIGEIKSFQKQINTFRIKNKNKEITKGNEDNKSYQPRYIDFILGNGRFKLHFYPPKGFKWDENHKIEMFCNGKIIDLAISSGFENYVNTGSSNEGFQVIQSDILLQDTISLRMEFYKNFSDEKCEIQFATYFMDNDIFQMERCVDYIYKEFHSLINRKEEQI